MKPQTSLAIYVTIMALGVAASGSCSSARKAGVRVVHLAAEECVQIARPNAQGTLEAVCATVDDLAPYLEQIAAAQRAAAAAKASGSAAVSAAPSAAQAPASAAPALSLVR
jgi:hypothetical protein